MAAPVFNGNLRGLGEPFYNVKAYGAKGDGLTDDYQAIQNAITAAAGGGTIYLPAGNYHVSQAPTITLNGHQFNIVGDGMDTKITSTATTQANNTGCLRVVGAGLGQKGADFIGIENINLIGTATCGMGLRLENCTQGTLKNVNASGFTAPSGWGVGIYLNQSIDIVFINPVVGGSAYANLWFDNVSNANFVYGGWLYNATGSNAGVRVNSSNGNVFYGTIIESNGGYGAVLTGGKLTRFYGCWIENNTSAGIYTTEVMTAVDGCWFTTNGIDIDYQNGADQMVVAHCDFNDGGKITIRAGTAGKLSLVDNRGMGSSSITNGGTGQLYTRNNSGYNPKGNITAPTMPASTTAYTHLGPADASVFITGGTVTAIAISGVSTGLTSGSFRVPVGQTITLTYSVAPTWTWFVD